MSMLTLTMIARSAIAFWLVVSLVRPELSAAQVPPYILAERYLVQVERLSNEQDYRAALDTMDSVVALHEDQDLILPDDFHLGAALSRRALSGSFIRVCA